MTAKTDKKTPRKPATAKVAEVAPAAPSISADMMAELKRSILEDMKSEKEKTHQLRIAEREAEKKKYDEYVEKMKKSSEPWVDIKGDMLDTEQGIRTELDWNDAFVQHLRENGVTGADDEQVVQHWVTLLLRDMADRMEDESPETSDFS